MILFACRGLRKFLNHVDHLNWFGLLSPRCELVIQGVSDEYYQSKADLVGRFRLFDNQEIINNTPAPRGEFHNVDQVNGKFNDAIHAFRNEVDKMNFVTSDKTVPK